MLPSASACKETVQRGFSVPQVTKLVRGKAFRDHGAEGIKSFGG